MSREVLPLGEGRYGVDKGAQGSRPAVAWGGSRSYKMSRTEGSGREGGR